MTERMERRRDRRQAYAWQATVRRHRWRIKLAQFFRRWLARLDP